MGRGQHFEQPIRSSKPIGRGRLPLVLLLLILWSAALAPAQAERVQVREDFSRDPGWLGRNNLPSPSAYKITTQDFGYSPTAHAGGRPGEIGGAISRSLTPARYAKVIPTRTLNDRLHASGKFAVTRSNSSGGALIGWFNDASRGWRTPNSLVFRLDGERGRFRVFFEYGTQTWKAGGGATFEGKWQTTTTPMFVADGAPHAWSLDYDPAGANGAGEITFTLDGKPYKAALRPGHKEEGAVFDRFGILNQQGAGGTLTLWLDDLALDGEAQDFSTDPGWEGRGNRVTFQDFGVRPVHDFGYRTTSRAGGQPGEIGGRIWRTGAAQPDAACHYGTPVGRLSMDDELRASGKVSLCAASADSAVLIGWYNSRTAVGAPPPNFIGVFVEGPSRIGHYFRPVYGGTDGRKRITNAGPIIRPDSASHTWTLHYEPKANDGRGRITVTLDGKDVSLDLISERHKGGANFDRFGVVSWSNGGHFVEIYFDDLSYTAQRLIP